MAIQQTFEFLGGGTPVDLLPEPTRTPCEPTALAAGVEGHAGHRDEDFEAGRGVEGPEASACGSAVPEARADGSAGPEASACGSGDTEAEQVSRETLLRQLRAQAGCIDTAPEIEAGEKLSTGSAAIDRLLPRRGLRPDAITEWVAEQDGCGASALSMIAAATHLRSAAGRGPLVVVSRPEYFYPPAAVALGIPVDRIIWVQPDRHADLVWTIDQALRCESVAAVWAPIRGKLDDRDARRFQLAAEIGRTPGLLIRTAATRGCPSFADVRFYISNVSRNLGGQDRHDGRVISVTLDRCRGGTIGQSVLVQIDDQARISQVTPQRLGIGDETAAVRLASELAHPASANRSHRQPGRRTA